MSSQAVDPRTATPFGAPVPDTGPAQLDRVLDAARAAFPAWRTTPPAERARALDAVAATLDERRQDLAELADRETGLGTVRLLGEVSRTTFQLRMFAELLREGVPGSVRVDSAIAGPPPEGRPELRRQLLPLGVVAVYAASNFPFAFGVSGGDTASALAAGCPVVVKAHPGHPRTSLALADAIQSALAGAGAPDGVFALVHGYETGRSLIRDRRVSAGAFTGSAHGGRALYDLACARPQPIPFYGELGSVNPVVATPGALAGRVTGFATEYVDSLTLGAGQFCTNPGLLLAPSGPGLAEAIAEQLAQRGPQLLLNGGVQALLEQNLATLASLPGARLLEGAGRDGAGTGYYANPALVRVPMAAAQADPQLLATECFGPVGVLVEYDSLAEAAELLGALPGCLVAAIHATEDEPVDDLIQVLTGLAGRVVWNGWPTGVAVAPAQHHGGPYPSTTSPLHTSVGAHAIDRFLRPVAFQNFPPRLVPHQGV